MFQPQVSVLMQKAAATTQRGIVDSLKGLHKEARAGHPNNVAFCKALQPGLLPGIDGSQMRFMHQGNPAVGQKLAAMFRAGTDPDTLEYLYGHEKRGLQKAAAFIDDPNGKYRQLTTTGLPAAPLPKKPVAKIQPKRPFANAPKAIAEGTQERSPVGQVMATIRGLQKQESAMAPVATTGRKCFLQIVKQQPAIGKVGDGVWAVPLGDG